MCGVFQNGLTSMHLAAQEDKVAVAEVLVKYGSQIDPQTKVWRNMKPMTAYDNSFVQITEWFTVLG